MKRPFLITITVIPLLLAVLLQAGCPGTERPVPAPQREIPAPKEQPPEEKPAAAKPGQFFPLNEGNKWEYLGEGNEYASFIREVVFTSGNLGQIREDNGGAVSVAVFEVSEDTVTRVFFQGEVYDRVNLLDRQPNEKNVVLKSPLQAGTKWKVPNGEREIIDTGATVNTPAGRFDNCIKVKITGQHSTLYEYFKDGTGMVKREFVSGETRVTSTLKNYTPGKS